MKRIFISHPYAGNPKLNFKKADNVCRYVTRKNMMPISPLHLFSMYECENQSIRENIMKICYRLIDISDEVWVYGNSAGCRMEKEYAEKTGKPVLIFYEEENYSEMVTKNKGVII